MAMAMKHTSPAARLLRHSRLFSLPPPLPRPSTENNMAGWVQDSDTATLPYPTHASLETTSSSLERGDWGLKRPLPLKSTTSTSTPIFRVKAIDTIDHVTDFEPSVDHALSLRKFQEMNLPVFLPEDPISLSQRRPADHNNQSKSVFEEYMQPTAKTKSASQEKIQRWKFTGKWLAGMERSEFEHFVEREIKQRRGEFREFLRNAVIEARKRTAKRVAIDRGEQWTDSVVELTEEDLQKEIRRLRQTRLDLWRLIWEFLDLPGSPPQADMSHSRENAGIVGGTGLDTSPPSTHRSAGLSYLRTASHVANHPILGPVSSQPPVQARLLQSGRDKVNGNEMLFGIGGFTTSSQRESGPFSENKDKRRSRFETIGGGKKWVQASHATVDSKGRVSIECSEAKADSVAIWENEDLYKPIDG